MLGEKVAKRQTESQQHPRKFTKAAAWECREPCPLVSGRLRVAAAGA